MISYSRESHQSIPSSAVKIVGLGGAGANMLERIALDSLDGAELLALNTDIRTLGGCIAKEKIQLGVNLTKGLGTGGDPELGQQAMLEAENNVREALKGQQIVFLCTGLGGGTGSGAAPIVARIAREEGAFVVVFATMPFFFEGRRRREQAETSLNQLAVLSNALVTFDNNRMGELVLAKQGIHEAFAAADKMISESIKAVIRLVIRPGLINVGLDDLMSALRTTRSRCLFGSGVAEGKDRASKALRNALSSPLLDQGSLLKEAQTVLVHLSGGESLTLFEIELLMQSLQKHVPEEAHVLFGAAIDPAMGDQLSITLISALPEDALTGGSRDSISKVSKFATDADVETPVREKIENPFSKIEKPDAFEKARKPLVSPWIEEPAEPEPSVQTTQPVEDDDDRELESDHAAVPQAEQEPDFSNTGSDTEEAETSAIAPDIEQAEPKVSERPSNTEKEERPFAEPDLSIAPKIELEKESSTIPEEAEQEYEEETRDKVDISPSKTPAAQEVNKDGSSEKSLWGKPTSTPEDSGPDEESPGDVSVTSASPQSTPLKLDSKFPGTQSELAFDNAPRGRFEGENPNVFDGEDLDLPPFLRKKKS